MQHAIAARRQRRIVRDQNQRGAALAVAAKQKFDDLASSRFVEISGRFVSNDDSRVRRQGAGERDPLLLAAGKLGRIMPGALGQSDRGEFAFGDRLRVRDAGELERHGDVLERRHGRDQMEGLKDDPDIAAAKTREPVLIEG